MIDRDHPLPVTQQARVLGISLGSVYYLPRPIPAQDLTRMRRIDELHLELPFAGNRMLRDECLNEHWFTHLLHARTVIETWRREYNEERPKKALGGMTPTAYAQHLTNTATIDPGL